MGAKDKGDAGVSPMEAQNAAQRHSGPAEPPLATSEGGQGARPDTATASQEGRPSPIRKGGEAEARDDR